MRLTGLCKSNIQEMEATGEFPHRVVLSQGRVGFSAEAIAKWCNARKPGDGYTNAPQEKRVKADE
jgi:predicted DNA-binding transcriptional regulator AlpA